MGEHSHMFRVACETQEGEVLALTGSSPDLGSWRKSAVLPMVQDSQDSGLWQLSVSLPVSEIHQYRYCVVVILQPIFPGNPKRIIVRRWETHFSPRQVFIRDPPEINDSH